MINEKESHDKYLGKIIHNISTNKKYLPYNLQIDF